MNPRHAVFLVFIAGWMTEVFGKLYVGQQLQIDVRPEDNPTSWPQSDVCVTGIPGYWVLDVNNRRVIVHRSP